jgi:excisionase family DNA binding protein
MSQVANPAVLTLEEAAAYLRLSPETVARQVSQGEIPGRQVGTEWRFLQSALDEWLSTRDTRQALLRYAGSFASDEALGELRVEAYRQRGRPETDPDPGA